MITDEEYQILALIIKRSGLAPYDVPIGLKDAAVALDKKGMIKQSYMDGFDKEGWLDVTSAGRLELNLYEKMHKK